MDTTVIVGILASLVVATGLYVWFRIGAARYQAIRDRRKDIPLFGGLVRLVVWEPNEGLVLLKYKRVADVIQGGGGMRFISAAIGDEVRARVPLTLRMVIWEDPAVLTRRHDPVKMRVAVWWRVADLSKYVFSIDSGVHVDDTHREVGLLEAAELWLKTLTESTLRTLASQASVALLHELQSHRYLHVDGASGEPEGQASLANLGSPESLAAELARELARKATDYGLEIQRVEIRTSPCPQKSKSPSIAYGRRRSYPPRQNRRRVHGRSSWRPWRRCSASIRWR